MEVQISFPIYLSYHLTFCTDIIPRVSSDDCSPQGSYLRRLCSRLDLVDTKYALIITDDDYFYPACIKECCHFLNQNSDFISCMGLPYATLRVQGTSKAQAKLLYKCINPLSVSPVDTFQRNYLNFSRYNPRYSYALTLTDLLRKIFNVFLEFQHLRVFAGKKYALKSYFLLLVDLKLLICPTGFEICP